MPGWGTSSWGIGVWGGDGIFGITESGGFNAEAYPTIVARYPAVNQVDVEENPVISVQFFDATFNLDTTSIEVYVDGVLAYSGTTGFALGYYGKVTYSAGSAIVQFTTARGFAYGQAVRVRARALDTDGNAVDDTWQFYVRTNAGCYSGLSPLAVEVGLQNPFTDFMALETLRTVLFNTALRVQNGSVANQGNKAARAIYKLAFATELGVLQNSFNTRDEDALSSRVCEKQNTLKIDTTLRAYAPFIDAAINEFKLLALVADEYIRSFRDYADSSLYIYRVSLVANMLLFAKSKELKL